MNILSIIIKREFIAKVRNKSFIVMTFLSPLLFVAIAAFVGYLSTMKSDVKKIAVHDETGMFVNSFKSDEEYQYLDMSKMPINVLRDSVISENYEGVLYIPKVDSNKTLESKIQFISNDSPGMMFIEDLQDNIAEKLTKDNLRKANLDTTAIKNAEANIDISLVKSSGEQSLKGLNEIKIAIGGAFGYLIMMFIIIYGNMVMRSRHRGKNQPYRRDHHLIGQAIPAHDGQDHRHIAGRRTAVFHLGDHRHAAALWRIDVFRRPSRALQVPPEMLNAAQHESGNMQLYIR
jgi:ABC-2 type transport system permease protein